jgi:hypothetical protein
MKDAMGRDNPAVVVGQASNNYRKARKRTSEHCSICTSRIWFDAVPLMEPEDVPEPRRAWVLCQQCYQALMVEMRRSPVRSPLRLRIAMGLVASERWPHSYSSTDNVESDRGKIIFIVWAFIIAMLVHLALIVMIAMIAH